LRRDHRPYFLKKLHLKFQEVYVKHFLRPQLESLGPDFTFMKPWHVELFGSPITIGKCVNVIATSDNRVRLSIWPMKSNSGRIEIGDYCLICPGVRIGCAQEIIIEDNCMIASNAYITDSDWHDLYNRIAGGRTAPVQIEKNAWIGDSAIICKGVTVGENSIVGAGSVVTGSIPPNTIAAGNPARVIKSLDSREKITTRDAWFSNPARLSGEIDLLDRSNLEGNTMLHWIRHRLFPRAGE